MAGFRAFFVLFVSRLSKEKQIKSFSAPQTLCAKQGKFAYILTSKKCQTLISWDF